MFESMACKTPVLAAPVGSVSDVIEDGKTGFLLENNSPACIARSILRAISSPDLERISQDGYDYVRENYTYARALEAWRKILSTRSRMMSVSFILPKKVEELALAAAAGGS